MDGGGWRVESGGWRKNEPQGHTHVHVQIDRILMLGICLARQRTTCMLSQACKRKRAAQSLTTGGGSGNKPSRVNSATRVTDTDYAM